MKFRNEEVSRNHASANKHCEGQEDIEELPPLEVTTGQRIGAKHLEGDLNHRAEEGIKKRIQETTDQTVVSKNLLIPIQGEFHRDESYFTGHDLIGAREATGQNVKQGEQEQNGDDAHDDGDDNVEYFFRINAFHKPLPQRIVAHFLGDEVRHHQDDDVDDAIE